ncbi:phosphoribosyltransferase domain-containing protein [Vibrio splendidus]|uniref:phosphoribosyltransferase domain-containing protein n=1 Tax=Vibrio splendidus TaxID=29497 RepID=UPI001E4B91D9|nr:phosphoribosyltransferase domain-containing protein [Vibrio splendidus]MCC4789135.1 phosphoribosyltransferase domain-containing protein [Vibrio splendidus]
MNFQYNISAGQVKLETNTNKYLLDKIVSFGCRENPKRHFMLINKILGRYTPTSPKVMRDTYDQLADMIGCGSSTFVVSFAEAATGLGAGVADSLSRKQTESVYFQHTTRHELNSPIWFSLDEKHSHAVDHIFYRPSEDIIDNVSSAKRLVIIDDEITTGRTISLLLGKLSLNLPQLQEVVIASVMQLNRDLSFLSENLNGIDVKIVNMIEADLTMVSRKDYKPNLPNNVNSNLSLLSSQVNFGRLAVKMPLDIKLKNLSSDKDTIVIADGEFQFVPFLIAESLEKSGVNVEFQSINRSPLSTCNIIKNKKEITNYENNAVNYIYNFFPQGKSVFVTSEKYYDSLLFDECVEYHSCI